jgi:hypothetical protein
VDRLGRALWIASVALWSWVSHAAGIALLVAGGFLIHPLTQIVLLAAGTPATLSRTNPLRELALELAFIIGLTLPLVAAATLHKLAWFYPSMMLVVGAHYLPFSFLYGMRQYVVLAAVLAFSGILIGLYAPQLSVAGAWFAGVVLIAFAFPLRRAAMV